MEFFLRVNQERAFWNPDEFQSLASRTEVWNFACICFSDHWLGHETVLLKYCDSTTMVGLCNRWLLILGQEYLALSRLSNWLQEAEGS